MHGQTQEQSLQDRAARDRGALRGGAPSPVAGAAGPSAGAGAAAAPGGPGAESGAMFILALC